MACHAPKRRLTNGGICESARVVITRYVGRALVGRGGTGADPREADYAPPSGKGVAPRQADRSDRGALPRANRWHSSQRSMMPLKFELDFEPEWPTLQEEWSPAPSEDIWRKFDCVAPEFSATLDQLWEVETETGYTGWSTSKREIRHHDCMWAGHCLSKEHRATRATTDTNSSRNVNASRINANSSSPSSHNNSEKECVKTASAGQQAPVKRTAVIVQRTVGRSLLLNRTNQQQPQQPQPQPHNSPQQKVQSPPERPETPQSLSESEDEATVRQEDDDYWESRYGRGVAATEVTGQVRRGQVASTTTTTTTATATTTATTTTATTDNSNVEFDHNYDAKTNVRLDDLGVQTPSDSGVHLRLGRLPGKVGRGGSQGHRLPPSPVAPHILRQSALQLAAPSLRTPPPPSEKSPTTRSGLRRKNCFARRVTVR
ncbi:hypothetical protein AAG570_013469 [Ranatra chinensis]|uniref:Uncharacterized protein n=1 Tax=Ranatra chinensis TaxID=642074 RepID=A0ABD0YC88_9HEMI